LSSEVSNSFAADANYSGYPQTYTTYVRTIYGWKFVDAKEYYNFYDWNKDGKISWANPFGYDVKETISTEAWYVGT